MPSCDHSNQTSWWCWHAFQLGLTAERVGQTHAGYFLLSSVPFPVLGTWWFYLHVSPAFSKIALFPKVAHISFRMRHKPCPQAHKLNDRMHKGRGVAGNGIGVTSVCLSQNFQKSSTGICLGSVCTSLVGILAYMEVMQLPSLDGDRGQRVHVTQPSKYASNKKWIAPCLCLQVLYQQVRDQEAQLLLDSSAQCPHLLWFKPGSPNHGLGAKSGPPQKFYQACSKYFTFLFLIFINNI